LDNVDYGGCKVVDMSMMPETLLPAPQYVVLDTEDETYAFSSIDKLVCKNGLFYIMDFRARKISVFDGGGKGVFAFSKNGRGPGEYLQVSDFDIDENGDFWILDAQSDALFHYRADGTFVSSAKTETEFSFMKYIGGGKLLLSVASYDSSDEKDVKVLVADTTMAVTERYSYGSSNQEQDTEMVFPSLGFCKKGDRIYYVSNGIEDDVAVFDENGGFEGVVHFDFAGRTVPSEMKSSVEEHWEEFMDYSFPTKTVCPVGDDVLVGCVVEISEEGMYSDYVMDRKTKTIYKQGPESQGLFLIGMGDGKLVYMLYPGLEGDDLCPPLPQEVKDAYDAGLDVIAYRNL